MGKIYTRAFKTHVYILYTYVGQKSTCVYSLHTLEHNILLCFYAMQYQSMIRVAFVHIAS